MKQRLIFCGTGGYHPSERRHTASLLLPDRGIAFDAGTGFFRVPGHLTVPNLDVFLTHAHLDHVCGLTYILVPLLNQTIHRVRVYGTRATLDAVQAHIFASEIFPVIPQFEWLELPDRVSVSDGGSLTWHPVAHPGGAVGFRIDWPNQSMAYITDTTAPGDYSDFVRGVDLLIHECYFPDSQSAWAAKTGHSAATPVAELARAAGARRLVLVHTDPQHTIDDPIGLTAIRQIFPETLLADDELELSF